MLAAGYAMDNMKPLDFGEALMPLIVASTPEANDLIKRQAEALIEAAKLVASQLTTAVKIGLYGEGAKADGDSSVLYPVRDRFWGDTEGAFFATLKDAAEKFDTAKGDLQDQHGDIWAALGNTWRVHMTRHALRIFDDAVPIESAESKRIVDVINARKMLLLALTGYGKLGDKLFKSTGPATTREEAQDGQEREEGRMTTPDLDSQADAAHRWWKALGPFESKDGRKFPGDRAALARLRRCSSPDEAAIEPATAKLFRDLGFNTRMEAHLGRAATLAAVLAHVRKDGGGKIALAIGARQGSDPSDALLKPNRFRTLMAARTDDEILTSFRRVVAMLDRTANVHFSFFLSFLSFSFSSTADVRSRQAHPELDR